MVKKILIRTEVSRLSFKNGLKHHAEMALQGTTAGIEQTPKPESSTLTWFCPLAGSLRMGPRTGRQKALFALAVDKMGRSKETSYDMPSF